jgi:hypothetical protein
MFENLIIQEGFRSLDLGALARGCTPVRGAYVISENGPRTDRPPREQILVCGTDPGTDRDPGLASRARELAIIRAELPKLGVEELFFSELYTYGFVLIVKPIEPIAMSETLAEGVWTYSPRSEVALGRLLKGLNELVWRAWEEAAVPLLLEADPEEELEEDGPEEPEDSGSSGEEGQATDGA